MKVGKTEEIMSLNASGISSLLVDFQTPRYDDMDILSSLGLLPFGTLNIVGNASWPLPSVTDCGSKFLYLSQGTCQLPSAFELSPTTVALRPIIFRHNGDHGSEASI
jgi:hypothetical protein